MQAMIEPAVPPRVRIVALHDARSFWIDVVGGIFLVVYPHKNDGQGQPIVAIAIVGVILRQEPDFHQGVRLNGILHDLNDFAFVEFSCRFAVHGNDSGPIQRYDGQVDRLSTKRSEHQFLGMKFGVRLGQCFSRQPGIEITQLNRLKGARVSKKCIGLGSSGRSYVGANRPGGLPNWKIVRRKTIRFIRTRLGCIRLLTREVKTEIPTQCRFHGDPSCSLPGKSGT